MSRFVLLDATPLGLSVHARQRPDFVEWLQEARVRGLVVVPEIADYELRRELLQANLVLSVRRLDRLISRVTYQPLSTTIMRRAARLWAETRQRGRPTADPHALDADVILAAGAQELVEAGHDVVVATDNARHLSLFVDARHWSDIEA